MRFSLLAMVLASVAEPVSAQTLTADHLRRTLGHILPAPACTTDEFGVEFAPGQSHVSEAARAQLDADLTRPRSCNVEAVYLAAYDPAALNAVRDLLIAVGLRAEMINAIQLAVPVAPWPFEVEHVRVTFVYR